MPWSKQTLQGLQALAHVGLKGCVRFAECSTQETFNLSSVNSGNRQFVANGFIRSYVCVGLEMIVLWVATGSQPSHKRGDSSFCYQFLGQKNSTCICMKQIHQWVRAGCSWQIVNCWWKSTINSYWRYRWCIPTWASTLHWSAKLHVTVFGLQTIRL